jgi:hypothetical protein
VATKGATTWLHTDGDGFATTTQLLTGSKYWVVFYQDPSLKSGTVQGDMGGIQCWPPEHMRKDHNFDGYFMAEAVVLTPGDML